MALISTTVTINLTPGTYKYYLNLGYNIPKFINKKGTESYNVRATIEVNVSDLPVNSIAKVFVECEDCGKQLWVPYNRYCNSIKKFSVIRCANCTSRFNLSGENHWNWKKEITEEERIIKRRYPTYLQFVYSVLERDKYTCQSCGIKNENLEVHHLDGYNWCIEKRTDPRNGIALCVNCHKLFHNKYGHKYNTKEQFLDWMNLKELNPSYYQTENVKYSKIIYCYENKKVYGSVLEYCKLHPKADNSKIYNVCNHKERYHSAYGKHFFWVSEILSKTNEELSVYLNHRQTKNKYPENQKFTDIDREYISTYLDIYNEFNK